MRHDLRIKFILAGLCALALVGCQRDDRTTAQGPTVALVMKTLNNPFFIDMQEGAQAAAKSLGVDLVVQAPEREVDVGAIADADRQIQLTDPAVVVEYLSHDLSVWHNYT